MKIIFLDIDGVLNGATAWPHNAGRKYLDPTLVKRLNRITDETGASLVISSTWRHYWDVEKLFKLAGVTAVVLDETPALADMPRGAEIEAWLTIDALDQNIAVERFIILDDDSDMFPHDDKLIKTSWARGLNDRHVEQAIERLNA